MYVYACAWLYLIFISIYVASYLYILHAYKSLQMSEREMDPLELKFQIVRYLVNAENQT